MKFDFPFFYLSTIRLQKCQQQTSTTLTYVDIYRIMLSDKKYGLSVNMMATRVMPSLLPQTVNPSLNLEQFMILLEVSLNHWRKLLNEATSLSS